MLPARKPIAENPHCLRCLHIIPKASHAKSQKVDASEILIFSHFLACFYVVNYSLFQNLSFKLFLQRV